jgi:hypothetical protein
MEAAIVLIALAGLAGASLRWANEGRPGFDPGDFDEVKWRLDGLLAEAHSHALTRRVGPSWRRQAVTTAGVWLVEAGQRLQGYGESLVMPSRLAATSDGSIHRGL